MPRGVYDRKAKKEAGDAAPKPKRQYTKRQMPTPTDLKGLALASLLLSAAHLEATVREQVEIDDNHDLQFALDSLARARAIYDAA